MGFSSRIHLSDDLVSQQFTTKGARLGSVGETTDGRVFVYALAGADIEAGHCVQAPTQGDFEMSTNTALYTGTTYTSTWNPLVLRLSTTWASVGGSTGATKDYFADGYAFTGSTEEKGGQVFHIKSNTTGSSDTGGYTLLTMYEGSVITENFDTETRVGVVRSPYSQVIQYAGAATPASPIVGIAPRNVSSGKYFWLQTWGVCCVETADVIVKGQRIFISTSTGVTIPCTDTDDAIAIAHRKLPEVGYCLATVTAAADFGLIFCTIRS
jgi:hypothetical protein